MRKALVVAFCLGLVALIVGGVLLVLVRVAGVVVRLVVVRDGGLGRDAGEGGEVDAVDRVDAVLERALAR